jgi:hypothetical protein
LGSRFLKIKDLGNLRVNGVTCLAANTRLGVIRGQFQNQHPIGSLKKYKIENKTLLHGTVTYITALLLHIVAVHI